MRYIGATVCIWLVVFGAEFAKELYVSAPAIPGRCCTSLSPTLRPSDPPSSSLSPSFSLHLLSSVAGRCTQCRENHNMQNSSAICTALTGKFTGSQTECGSITYYIVAYLPLPVILVSVYHLGNKLCVDYERKVALGYRFADGDITWTKPNVRFLPAVGLLVGVAAGALGEDGVCVAPRFSSF